ncbi:trace amine-associated receptor 7c-like [Acanthaster planci]|uniref:Trace amine-associated receptor 7c-like n=1 Tax=Acanthaster planci TaxID=133434 RepID=A0A8B7XW85_ACAPL|nr:trace amine-associated receptor 7c-like [Acanthaster planci]
MNATRGVEGSTPGKWICLLTALEGVVGFIGNLLVCFVILRVKFLHNRANYLLVNLAVADTLLCLYSVFNCLAVHENFALIRIVPTNVGGKELFCRLLASRYFSWAFSCASAYNLCVVTLERYVAIVHPLQYERKLTATRMTFLIALSWTTSFLFSTPLLFSRESSKDPDKACLEFGYPSLIYPVSVGVFLFLLSFLIPIMSMSFAYYKMQVTLKRQANALNLQHARAAAYDLVIARQRLVNMLTIVVGAQIILWTPSYINSLICLYPSDNALFAFCGSTRYIYFRGISNFAFYLNSVINPIIYEFKYKKFRQGFKIACCSCFKRRGNNRVDADLSP